MSKRFIVKAGYEAWYRANVQDFMLGFEDGALVEEQNPPEQDDERIAIRMVSNPIICVFMPKEWLQPVEDKQAK